MKNNTAIPPQCRRVYQKENGGTLEKSTAAI